MGMLREVHDEKGLFRGQLVMNDNELLRIDWFAGREYQRFFNYIDDLQGMWLHRWGDHLVRTFGVAMHLAAEEIAQLSLPYAHQEICLCGAEHLGLHCERTDESSRPQKTWRWRCV